MGSAWAAADAISGAAVSVVPVVAREPETFAAVLAPAQRIGELWCVAGHVKAAWRQRVRPLHRSERGHDAGDCNFGDDASGSTRFDEAPPGIAAPRNSLKHLLKRAGASGRSQMRSRGRTLNVAAKKLGHPFRRAIPVNCMK